MFSSQLKQITSRAESIGTTPPIDSTAFQTLLEKAAGGETLELESTVELLNGTLDPGNRRILTDFAAGYRRPRDRELLLLPPLYFSSICENRCRYCDFSSGGLRLSLDEFAGEVDSLLGMGYRSIELVSGQDPDLFRHKNPFPAENQRFDLSRVIPYFQISKRKLLEAGNGMLTSNIPPVDSGSFHELKAAGLDCYLLWLETFNTRQYSLLHDAGGPKSSPTFRFDSFEHALDAGIEHIAGAYLKGLYEWRKEEVVLYALDRYLKAKFGHGFSIIGTPRLKGQFVQSEFVKAYEVSDEDYEVNIALDRILFDGILWLQTRESPEMNRKLITKYGGGVILTVTCSTAPGGYAKVYPTKAQFPVHRQDLHKMVRLYEEDGFTARFDWNSRTLAEFQRTR